LWDEDCAHTFFCSVCCCFTLLSVSFTTEASQFHIIPFVWFFFSLYAFNVLYKNNCLYWYLEMFIPCFLLDISYFSGLTFRCLIQVELISEYGERYESIFILLHISINLLKWVLSLIYASGYFVEEIFPQKMRHITFQHGKLRHFITIIIHCVALKDVSTFLRALYIQ
jgi:hypothetical protein